MDKKIQDVLSRLQKQAEYENQHKKEFEHDERILAITKETGLFYNILLKAVKAKKILEIGLSAGYSTLWFAEAVLHNTNGTTQGKAITTIEQNPKKIQIAKENFTEAGVSEIIDIRHGLAGDVLSEISNDLKNNSAELYDFVFIDADKENSISYFDTCLKLVKKGGIIAADNILDMSDMKKYEDYVQKKSDVISVTIPIGWGEEISIKTT